MVTEASISTLVSQGGGTERDVRGKGWDGVSKNRQDRSHGPCKVYGLMGFDRGEGIRGGWRRLLLKFCTRCGRGVSRGPGAPGRWGNLNSLRDPEF